MLSTNGTDLSFFARFFASRVIFFNLCFFTNPCILIDGLVPKNCHRWNLGHVHTFVSSRRPPWKTSHERFWDGRSKILTKRSSIIHKARGQMHIQSWATLIFFFSNPWANQEWVFFIHSELANQMRVSYLAGRTARPAEKFQPPRKIPAEKVQHWYAFYT